MKDKDKTQKQLITELTQFRRRIAELEAEGRKRNQLEESLRTERDKAQQYLDIAEVMLVVLDKQGIITLINRKGNQILGYKEGELIGKNWFTTCLPTHLRKDVKGVFKKLMAGKRKQTEFYENPVLTKSGTEKIVVWHNTVLKDAQGTIIGTLSSGEDITDRKQAEEALQDSETRFRTLFEGIPNIVLVHDGEGTILHINEIGAHQLEWSAKDLVDRNLREIVTPENAASIANHARETHKVGWCRFETTYVSRSGWQIMAEVTERPIKLGEVKAILSVAHDISERKQVENELRKFKEISDKAGHGVSIVDLEGNVIYNNAAYDRMHGYTPDEVIGKHLSIFHTEKQMANVNGLIEQLNRKGNYVAEEVWHKRKDNSEFPTLMTGTLIKDANGTPLFMAGTAIDITERKQAEETLRQTNETLQAVLEALPVAIFDLDTEGVIQNIWNPAAERMLGWSRQEVLGKFLPSVQTEEAKKEFKNFREQMQLGKSIMGIDLHRHRKDSSPIEYSLYAAPIHDSHGQVIGNIAMLVDITERKVMEEELRKSEERFRSLVETMKVGLGAIDENGVLTYVNEYFSKMLGYTIDEMIGRSTLDFYYDEESRKAQEEIFAKRREGMRDPTPYEVTWRKKDGLKVYSILSPTPSFDADGRFIGSFAIHTDITERKQTEEALQRSYEQLQETLITTVNALTSMVEMKDRYTAGHQPRVAQLACAIAEAMGLSEEQIEGIRMAGLVHDIGKINIPAEILSKPGQLTEIQYDMVKMHPQASYEILKGIKFPWAVAEIVLQHHERMDGSGYPQGLSGKEILLEARILAVANVVEAMTSHRPYRPAHDIKEALQEISQKKDVFYDPDVVDACLKLFTEKRFSFD